MEKQNPSGGCLCGKVRYQLLAPAKVVEHCHCSQCRRAHGALYASGGLFNTPDVKIMAGKNNLTRYESSAGNWREFCTTCGCHLFMTVDQFPDEIYVWVASLDEGAHPGHPADKDMHVFTDSRAAWETLPPGNHFETLPPDSGIGKN